MIVNAVGRERMLSQKAVNEAVLATSALSDPHYIEKACPTAHAFDLSLFCFRLPTRRIDVGGEG